MWTRRKSALLGLSIGAIIPVAIVALLPPPSALFACMSILVTGVLFKDARRNRREGSSR